MKIRSFSVLFFVLCFHCVFSQPEDQEKRVNQYFSIQANQLLRQLVNFGGSNQAISNPYLLNYSLNSSKSLFGFNAGIGYFISDSKDNGEDIDRETKARDFNFRVGLDQKKNLSERWMLALGVDILFAKRIIESDNSSPNSFDEDLQDEFHTESETRGVGFGPRLNFSFAITPKVMLSTETSYYLAFSKTTGKSTSSSHQPDFQNGSQQMIKVEIDEEDPTRKTTDFSLELPVVVNLVFRF